MDIYDIVILIAFVAFIAVAFMLLWPVYRFLKREEQASEAWTERAIQQRQARDAATHTNGDPTATPDPEADAPTP